MENFKSNEGEDLKNANDDKQNNYIPKGGTPEAKRGLKTPAKIAIGVGIALVILVVIAAIL